MSRLNPRAPSFMRGSCIDRLYPHRKRPRLQHVRALLLAGLIPAALAAAAVFPATAGAATRGFHVYDLSSYRLYFNGVVSGSDETTAPALHSILQPGVGYDDFEQTYILGETTQAEASYAVLQNGMGIAGIGTFRPYMQIYSISDDKVYCTVDFGACSPQGTTYVDGSTIEYLDPPGTVHNIPAGQGQAQAATLNQFCADDNSATCTFTPTGQQEVWSPSHQVGDTFINNTNVLQHPEVDIDDSVGTSDSIDVTVKAGFKLFKVVDVSISATYGHEWTTEHRFIKKYPYDCEPHNKCWLEEMVPMLRTTGDFTLKLGNTTWNLPGVYFDSPDPNGNGAVSANAVPLTQSQLSTLAPGVHIVKRATRTYTLPRAAGRNAIARPSLHLAVSGPRTVRAGTLNTYRILLTRSQPQDRVSYTLRNVRVQTDRGRRLGSWLVSQLLPRQTRTLLLRVAVPASARGRVCFAATATAKNAHSTRIRYCAAVTSLPPPFTG